MELIFSFLTAIENAVACWFKTNFLLFVVLFVFLHYLSVGKSIVHVRWRFSCDKATFEFDSSHDILIVTLLNWKTMKLSHNGKFIRSDRCWHESLKVRSIPGCLMKFLPISSRYYLAILRGSEELFTAHFWDQKSIWRRLQFIVISITMQKIRLSSIDFLKISWRNYAHANSWPDHNTHYKLIFFRKCRTKNRK